MIIEAAEHGVVEKKEVFEQHHRLQRATACVRNTTLEGETCVKQLRMVALLLKIGRLLSVSGCIKNDLYQKQTKQRKEKVCK